MRTTDKEVPACAAIRSNSTGVIVAGKRHHNCLNSLSSLNLNQPKTWEGSWKTSWVQGFMTTHGRFVNRVDAKLLMERAGRESADPEGYRGNELYSEDLY